MAQSQKAAKQPQDPYARQGKTLASSVQRLRGWVGSDPSRTVELADALVELTQHRLLGHGYAAAAADAQDSVRRAAQLLTASGPIGPYTSPVDAARYLTSVVHLATIQIGIGLPDAAGRTLESLEPMRQQLEEVRLEVPVEASTAVWALSAQARSALAAGDVALANAGADEASALLTRSGLTDDTEAAYLSVDVLRLASDCRWAAGRTAEALGYLHDARDRYEATVGGRLDEPARLSPALRERLAEPLFGLYRDLADRLLVSGELDLAVATRRQLVERLQKLSPSLGETARLQLASALADLTGDLLTADRLDEAGATAAEADGVSLDWPAVPGTRLLVAEAYARTLIRTGRSSSAVERLRSVLQTVPDDSSPAARALAWAALAEALRSEGDDEAAAAAEQSSRDVAAGLGAATQTAPTPVALRDLARRVVPFGTAISWAPSTSTGWVVTPRSTPPSTVTSGPAQTAEPDPKAWLQTERAEAHQLEQERLEQARLEARRREAERLDAEQVAAEQRVIERARAEEAERREAEQREAAEEEERRNVKRRREERLEAHRLEVEQREAERLAAEQADAEPTAVDLAPALDPADGAVADQLTLAQQAWSDAKERGDRRGARAINERVVELLRPRAEADPDTYGLQLQYALEELSSARLRSGDVWGSRAPAREAKALAKTLAQR